MSNNRSNVPVRLPPPPAVVPPPPNSPWAKIPPHMMPPQMIMRQPQPQTQAPPPFTCNTSLSLLNICKAIDERKEVCANGVYINSSTRKIYPCLNHVSNKVMEAIYSCDEHAILELMNKHPESALHTMHKVFYFSTMKYCNMIDKTDQIIKMNLDIGFGFTNRIKAFFIKLMATTPFINEISRSVFAIFYHTLSEDDIIKHIDYLVEIMIIIYGERVYPEFEFAKVIHRKADSLMLKRLLSHDKFARVQQVIEHLMGSLKFVQLTDKEVLRYVESCRYRPKPEEVSLITILTIYVMQKYNINGRYSEFASAKELLEMSINKNIYMQIYKYFDTMSDEFIVWLWDSEIINKDNHLHSSSIYVLQPKQFQRLIDLGISFYDDGNKYLKLAKAINKDIATILSGRPEIRGVEVGKE